MENLKLRVIKVNYQKNGNKIKCNIEYFIDSCIVTDFYVKHKSLFPKFITAVYTPKGYGLTFTTTGSSICHPNDIFDNLKGRRIAYSRAFINGYNEFNKMLHNITKVLNYQLSYFTYNTDRTKKIRQNEKEHLKNTLL